MLLRLRGLTPAAAWLLAGCAFLTPPIPNPTGLPEDALTLEYVLERGCLPYMLGEKSEDQAMRGLRLNHIHPLPGLEPGESAPYWAGSYPGLSSVRASPGLCNINMHGRNFAAFRAAAQTALRDSLGADPEQDANSGYKAWVPGQLTGCRKGVRYAYYQVPGRPFFTVELNQVNCARDPLRTAR